MTTGLANYVGYVTYAAGEVETVELVNEANAAEFAAAYGLTVVKVKQKDGYQAVTLKGAKGAMSAMLTEFWN